MLQAYREFSKQIDEYKANNAIIEYLKTPLTPAEIKALESKPVVTVEEHVTGTVIPVSVPVPTAPRQVTGNRQGVSVGIDCTYTREWLVPKMCTSRGCQCKTIPILELYIFGTCQPTNTVPITNTQNMRKMCTVSSDFRFVPNILSFSSIIYVDKWD